MVDADFSSCWLKFGQAMKHLDTLKCEMGEWKDSRPYSTRRDHDPEGARHCLILEIHNAPRVDRWSLLAGDCVHNLRSALDHVTYALAIRGSRKNPPPGYRAIQFPIFDCPTKFEEKRPRIKDLSTKAQTFIEGAQPYNRRDPVLPPVLGVLNEFDNSDKHRLLNLALTHIGKGEITFPLPCSGVRSPVNWVVSPMTHGAEVAYFTVYPPQPDMKYETDVTFHITVAHIPGPTGMHVSPLQSILDALVAETKRILDLLVTC